jgi:hypothetical protein
VVASGLIGKGWRPCGQRYSVVRRDIITLLEEGKGEFGFWGKARRLYLQEKQKGIRPESTVSRIKEAQSHFSDVQYFYQSVESCSWIPFNFYRYRKTVRCGTSQAGKDDVSPGLA